MVWINKEKSTLIKPWEGVPDDRPKAEETFSLSSKGDFLIVARVGDIVHPYTGGISTYQDLAGIIRQDIINFGWENFTFEYICYAYIEYLKDLH